MGYPARMLEFIATLIPLALLVAFVIWIVGQANDLPTLNPKTFDRSQLGDKKLLVCIGDSITHGSVSHNYPRILRHRIGFDFVVVNAGINSDLACTVARRLDEIIALRPDAVSILIGTNDVLATMSAYRFHFYRAQKRILPEDEPSPAHYEAHLRDILERLRSEIPESRVALFSIPILGENLKSRAIEKTIEYSATAKRLADEFEVTYLPIGEQQREILLREEGRGSAYHWIWTTLSMYTAVFKHYALHRSWDQIGKSSDLILMSDGVHMNSRSAKLIVELLEGWIRKPHPE